jgi:hypothetical protein
MTPDAETGHRYSPYQRSAGGIWPHATSSSRTAGTAVDRGYFRTSRAAGAHFGAVLVGFVAVFRSCTDEVVRNRDQPRTGGADQGRDRVWRHLLASDALAAALNRVSRCIRLRARTAGRSCAVVEFIVAELAMGKF